MGSGESTDEELKAQIQEAERHTLCGQSGSLRLALAQLWAALLDAIRSLFGKGGTPQ